MILNRISILNFKNLRQVETCFSPNINCLIGNNGEGKTNLLDAIYYLSFCRSSNNPADAQLITHDEEFFSIEGQYTHDDASTETVNCSLKRGHNKVCRRNRKAYRRLSEHIGLIPLVLVTPQDSLLVEAAADERRRFMDVVISQYDPAYIVALGNYNKALQQRNAMLRAETEPDLSLIELWEEEMAQYGSAVYAKRNAFISEFTPCFQHIYDIISGGREKIDLSYVSHGLRGDLLDVIRSGRDKDRAVGFSLHGIHRDDIDLRLGGYNIKREGSQGQHKTLVLSMKLAQFDFLRRTRSGTTPLLLLDDIFDKLDAGRVEKIVSLVASDAFGQIFITDTNRTHLDNILSSTSEGYKLFHVENGALSVQSEV
ncbi:MAG: DNA replication/repair protein RecF [Prevotella sp.]|nr:DNA replication/repair protein RecF [Prevotella sp.]